MNKKGQLSESTPCVSCGYELVGLAPEGVCPECGVDILRSLNPERLASQPRAVLWRIQIGAMLLAGVLALGPFLCFAGFLVGEITPAWLWWVIGGCWAVVFAAGLWSISVRWKTLGARADVDDGMWRVALRVFVLFIPFLAVLAFLIAIGVSVLSVVFFVMLFFMILLVIFIVLFFHVQFLARRIPSKGIQSLMTAAQCMSGVGMLLVVCGVIIPPIALVGVLLAMPGLLLGAVGLGELALVAASLRRMREY